MKLVKISVTMTWGILLLLNLSGFATCLADEFVIGTDGWPPFRIIQNGEFSGIDVDLCKEIEKRLPIKFKFKKVPWIRALRLMKEGEIDIITGVAKREEREVYILYTDPPYYSGCSSVFYAQKGKGHLVRTYDDLYNFKIGYVVDSAYFLPFDTDERLDKHKVTRELQLLKMLDSGRLDLIIGTDCQVDYHIKTAGIQNKFEKAIYRPSNAVDLYIGLSKRSPATRIKPDLDRVIRQIKEEGVIQRILFKYFH
ncbi:MAG: amino acid ABC transporter substrate-binding protein [Desulfobacter sp.]|nr:MAG: amino acid ABC transporter substrate-binding protein [Desulfobacter sp.]